MGEIEITPDIKLNEDLLEWEFVRAQGPGGQNVNKVATAAKLYLNLNRCTDLPAKMRERLVRLAGRKMTQEGILVIHARRFRTQQRNRQDAVERLVDLMKKAAWVPKKRRPTRPTLASKEKIKAAKLHRMRIKRLRRPITNSEE